MTQLTTQHFSSAAPLEKPMRRHIIVRLPSGKVLIAAGIYDGSASTKAFIYDPEEDTWTPATDSAITWNYGCGAVLLPNGKVLVAGSTNSGHKSALYDEDTDTWTTVGDLNGHSYMRDLFLLPNSKCLVIGDTGSSNGYCELYDIGAQTWANGPVASTVGGQRPTNQFRGISLANGDVLVVGGDTASSKYIVRYHWSSNTWSTIANGTLQIKRREPCLALLDDGRVMIAGGAISGLDANSLKVDIYDPLTDTISPLSDSFYGRQFGSLIQLDDGKVLYSGGKTYDSGAATEIAEPTSEFYDVDSDTWSIGPIPPTYRTSNDSGPYRGDVTVKLEDGTIFWVCGFTGSGTLTRSDLFITPPPPNPPGPSSVTLSNGFTYAELPRNYTNTFDFIGAGCELKTYTMIDLIQPWYDTRPGSRLLAIMCAIGDSDADIAETDKVDSAIRKTRDNLFVGTAAGAALSVIGQNYNIKRPTSAQANDTIYRNLIKAMAFARRGSLKTIYDVVRAFLGTQEEAGWDIFDPGGNQIVIHARNVADVRTPQTATYFHKNSTLIGEPDNPLTKFPGDYFMSNPLFDGTSQTIRSGLTGTIIPGASGSNAKTFSSRAIPRWVTAHAYALGDMAIKVDGSRSYICVQAGTSSSEPSGTGTNIADGTVLWDFYSGILPQHIMIPTGVFVGDYLPVDIDVFITVNGVLYELGEAPHRMVAVPSNKLLPDGTGLSWRLGDILESGESVFVPEDVGGTIVIDNATTISNNRSARVIGFIDSTKVVLEAGAFPFTSDANDGNLHWQLYRGVRNNVVCLTGNTVVQDLEDALDLVKMSGVVITIGDVTI